MTATNTVSLLIAGNEAGPYVRKVRSTGHLCNPGDHYTIVVDPSVPYTLNPGQSVALTINSVLVLTGYVIEVVRETLTADVTLEIDDTYHRLNNYFIDDKDVTQTIQSTSQLVAHICGLAGVSYSISGTDASVPAGTNLGLRPARDAINDVITYASWYAYPDASGVVQFGRAPTSISGTLSSFLSFEQSQSDEQTRNIVKVFGTGGIPGTNQGAIFAKASASTPGLLVDMVAAVGSPLIETQAEAERVANYMLQELSPITNIIRCEVIGNPNIRIGQKWGYSHDADGFTTSGSAIVTSLESEIGENGYIQNITLGQRCPRIAGWSIVPVVTKIYAGTNGSGIYLSNDKGTTWSSFNTGLPTGNKYVRRIAANPFDEVMAIVNGRLYYNGGTSWSLITLPSPINSAGDSPAPTYRQLVAVDSNAGAPSSFDVLAINQNITSGSEIQAGRSWVYSTTNSGSAWNSVELNTTTGSGYHVIGIDMSSFTGIPTVVATTGSGYVGLIPLSMNRIAVTDAAGFPCADPQGLGVSQFILQETSVTGSTPNRIATFAFLIRGWATMSQTTADRIGIYWYSQPGYGAVYDLPPYADSAIAINAETINIFGDGPGFQTSYVSVQLNVTAYEATVGSLFSFRFGFENVSNNPANGPNILYVLTGEGVCVPSVNGSINPNYRELGSGVIVFDMDDP